MTKDTKKTDTNKTENLLMSLKANEKAKKVLFLATNLSNNLSKLVPKMGISVDEIITEIDKRQDIKIKGQIDFNFLKSHLYTLASYDKAKKDRAFEMAVVRGVKLGIKMNSEPKVFKEISNEFLTELNKVYNLANKKDHAKLLSMIDEKVIENLGNMKALLEDNSIRTEWTKANDLMANDVSGNLKQA